MYPRLDSFNQFQLKVFSDASSGNLLDQVSSARGHLVFLSAGENVSHYHKFLTKSEEKSPVR